MLIADERVGVQVKTVRVHVPYLSASEVMIHEQALYQVYVPSPLPVCCKLQQQLSSFCTALVAF